jgi:hypothetical protein
MRFQADSLEIFSTREQGEMHFHTADGYSATSTDPA